MKATFRVNLFVETADLKRKKRKKEHHPLADPLILGALAISLAVGGWAYWTDMNVGKNRASLVEDVKSAMVSADALQDNVRLANEFRLRSERIDARMEVLRKIDIGRYVWPHILDQVALAVPPDLWLSGWQEDGPVQEGSHNVRFTLTGYAANHEVLSSFLRDLEASPFLAGVSLGPTKSATISEHEVTEFSISAHSIDPAPQFLDWQTAGAPGAAPAEDESVAPDSSQDDDHGLP